jgi:hypothetical protein
VAADKTDEPGVLGNLPRSRPGHRSDKRGGGVRAAASAARTGAAKAGARTGSARKKPATTRKAPRPQRERPPERPAAEAAAQSAPDPLTSAVRLAGKVAEAGLKTAGSLLRRLPGR